MLAVAAAAQPSAGVSSQPPTVLSPVEGPLTIDGRYLGDLSGSVDVQGRGVVDSVRLVDLLSGVLAPDALRELKDRIGAAPRVAMADLLTEGFALEFDTLSLTFIAKIGMTARGRREVSLGQAAAIDPAIFDPPARFATGLNITVGQGYDLERSAFRPAIGSAELYANFGGFEGFTLTSGFTYDGSSDERWRRRETRVTKDIFRSAIRLTGGELAASVSGFQGTGRILGISAERAFGVIRPFQNIRPSGRRQFILDQTSFVEVEVNGVLVQRLQLDPGPYSLADFPFGRGANSIRLLIEDPTGRREIAMFDLFGGAGLLDRGILDFAFSAGLAEEPGREFRYSSSPAVSGFVQMGVLDSLTLGANAQFVSERGAQAGVMGVFGSRLGLVQLQGAFSRNADSGRTGFAAAVDYTKDFSVRQRDDLAISFTAQTTSRHFQDAFSFFGDSPEKWRVAGQASWRANRWTVNLGAAMSKGRESAPDQKNVDFSVGRSFGRVGLNAALGWRENSRFGEESRLALGLNLRLGARSSVDARYDSATRLREIGYSRATSGELNDLSGAVRLGEDRDRQAVAADLRYIHNRFEGQLAYNRLTTADSAKDGPSAASSNQDTFLRASTFIGYADGAVAIGRPAREGFVIATKHKSLKASRLELVASGGRVVARSGLLGPPLAGIDRAYGINRFEEVVQPLPEGYDLGSGVISIFPGLGNGYRARVGSDASRMVMGVLVGPKGPLALITGVIEPVVGGEKAKAAARPFFTNRNGRFVGDRLAPGRYRIIVDGQAVGELNINEDQEGVIDVGQIQTRAP